MDKLRALRYFLAVAECSSFRAAASQFSVPASSVSRRISDLEHELKIELFHRSTRVVKLTGLGQIYYDQIKDIVSALDRADELVSERSGTISGPIKISVMSSYARACLFPALEKLNQVYPEMVIDVTLTDSVTDLAGGHVDIAIRGSSVLPDRAVAKKLSNNRFELYASQAYLADHGRPRHAEDLLAHKTLLYRGPNGIMDWQVSRDGEWQSLKTDPAYVSNDSEALKRALLAGKGIALVPTWGARHELEKGSIEKIELEGARVSPTRSLDSGIFLLYLKPRYDMLKIKVAVDFLVAELKR